jgi:hypothetical protein
VIAVGVGARHGDDPPPPHQGHDGVRVVRGVDDEALLVVAEDQALFSRSTVRPSTACGPRRTARSKRGEPSAGTIAR